MIHYSTRNRSFVSRAQRGTERSKVMRCRTGTAQTQACCGPGSAVHRAAQAWRWPREHAGRAALHPERESEVCESEY
jgi:hypothetical protein